MDLTRPALSPIGPIINKILKGDHITKEEQHNLNLWELLSAEQCKLATQVE